MKPIVTISEFNEGMVEDPKTGFATMYCCDIHRQPGILRPQCVLEATADSAINTAQDTLRQLEPHTYTEDITGHREIMLFGHSDRGNIYGYGAPNSYVWTLYRDNTEPDFGNGMKSFNGCLYYVGGGSLGSNLGRMNGDPTNAASWNDTFQALTGTSVNHWAPMIIFAGALYGGQAEYVWKLEADGVTFTANALVLPTGSEVRCMTEWNNYIVLSVHGTASMEECVYLWDGISEFWTQKIVVPKPGVSAFCNLNNYLKAFIENKCYAYTGSDFEIEFTLPKLGDPTEVTSVSVAENAIELYEERMIFGATAGSGNPFLSGVYSWGSHGMKYPDALAYEFRLRTGAVQPVIGAIKTFGSINNRQIIYVSYADYGVSPNKYGVDVLDPTEDALNWAYFLTPVVELPGDFGNLITGIKLEFAGPMNTTQAFDKVEVYYRGDKDISYDNDTLNWTLLGQIDNDTASSNNQGLILKGVYKRFKKVQFKCKLTCDTSRTGHNVAITKLHIY